MVLVGGLRPEGDESEQARYPIPPEISFVALPYHESLADPRTVFSGRWIYRFWRALDDVDAVWLFGPHPSAISFALIAAARRRRVLLGARQDTVAYVRSRHPRRPVLHGATRLLEAAFRVLARRFPIVVVGPELGRKYRRARRLLQIAVSLVEESDIVEPHVALSRNYAEELKILSVGRLEKEKNPLLLADALAALNRDEARWRLLVCGEGGLAGELSTRLEQLGQSDHAELLGYVPFGERLADLYRTSHVLLHTSWTEGFPQVLPEAFAAGLPVVAADVGGIRAAVGDAALLVPPGDAGEASRAVHALAADPGLRARVVQAGHKYVVGRTVEFEVRRVADFLEGGLRGADPGA